MRRVEEGRTAFSSLVAETVIDRTLLDAEENPISNLFDRSKREPPTSAGTAPRLGPARPDGRQIGLPLTPCPLWGHRTGDCWMVD
jgi:hypothetical protein